MFTALDRQTGILHAITLDEDSYIVVITEKKISFGYPDSLVAAISGHGKVHIKPKRSQAPSRRELALHRPLAVISNLLVDVAD